MKTGGIANAVAMLTERTVTREVKTKDDRERENRKNIRGGEVVADSQQAP